MGDAFAGHKPKYPPAVWALLCRIGWIADYLCVISLVVLAIAILALCAYRLAGAWRWIYIVGAMLALYLNVFVGVVQAFQKLPALTALAPTQSEPPFLVTQLVVLVVFALLGIVAVKRFHPEAKALA